MHERMTGPTQPSHLVQHMLFMPTSFQRLCMNRSRNQMVVRKRNPIAAADLAGRRAGSVPCRRWSRDGSDVGGENWTEEGEQVGFWWGYQGVGSQGVCDGGRHGLDEGISHREGQWVGICLCERRAMLECRVGERPSFPGERGEGLSRKVLPNLRYGTIGSILRQGLWCYYFNEFCELGRIRLGTFILGLD